MWQFTYLKQPFRLKVLVSRTMKCNIDYVHNAWRLFLMKQIYVHSQ